MCIVCVCGVCALLSRSLVTVSGRLATREFRHQPTLHRETIPPPRNHHATNQLAAKQSSRGELAVPTKVK